MRDGPTTAGASEPAAPAPLPPPRRWTRRHALHAGLGLTVSAAALLGSCSLPSQRDADPEQLTRLAGKPAALAPRIAPLPAADRAQRRPDKPVVVHAAAGRLAEVTVTDPRGKPVAGRLDPAGRSWTTTENLNYATTYTVKARAINDDGAAVERVETFTTLRPPQTTSVAQVTPDPAGEGATEGATERAPDTYGVGMPVIVRFAAPVRRRDEVARALRVQASRPVEGAWRWVAADEAHFRPRQYWPAYTTVDLHLDLRGVEVSPGVWGSENRRVTFRIGAATVSRVDAASLRMRVVRDGKLAREIPVTTGSSRSRSYTTRSGIKVISERKRVEIMESPEFRPGHPEYYRLRVNYALRITDSGEFVHAAPWSARAHGRRRVSHGCIGMSTVNAKWLFDDAQIGDVVEVVNTGRQQDAGNGWTQWNVPWQQWTANPA